MCGPTEATYRSEKGLSVFRRAVYAVVAKIPEGRVLSYGAVAAKAGNARAARAVGTALAENRYWDVPCHRVVRSDGTLGDYAFGGPEAKRKRLKQEGVAFDQRGRAVFPS